MPAFSNLVRAVRERFHSSSVSLPSLSLSSPMKTFIAGVVGVVAIATMGEVATAGVAASLGVVAVFGNPDPLGGAADDLEPDDLLLDDVFFVAAISSSAVNRPSPFRSNS